LDLRPQLAVEFAQLLQRLWCARRSAPPN
jgi:hypothetical protein